MATLPILGLLIFHGISLSILMTKGDEEEISTAAPTRCKEEIDSCLHKISVFYGNSTCGTMKGAIDCLGIVIQVCGPPMADGSKPQDYNQYAYYPDYNYNSTYDYNETVVYDDEYKYNYDDAVPGSSQSSGSRLEGSTEVLDLSSMSDLFIQLKKAFKQKCTGLASASGRQGESDANGGQRLSPLIAWTTLALVVICDNVL